MKKPFKLTAADIRPLAPGHGGAVASDGIMVDGRLVGVMRREATERPNDSGWIFEGAGEPPEDLADPSRYGVYDVNTIANYDPAIIEHLDAPPGTVCLRDMNGIVPLKPDVARAFLAR